MEQLILNIYTNIDVKENCKSRMDNYVTSLLTRDIFLRFNELLFRCCFFLIITSFFRINIPKKMNEYFASKEILFKKQLILFRKKEITIRFFPRNNNLKNEIIIC